MQSRQSPISSRKRSTTTVRSDGTVRVAACCSSRYVSRFRAAVSLSLNSPVSRASAFVSVTETSSRDALPIASPSS